MLFWECRRRLDQLIEFRKLAVEYFSNLQYADWMSRGSPPRLNEISQRARSQINLMMHDLVDSFDLMGVSHTITYTPPPIIGGYIRNIDVIGNIFDLWQFEVPSSHVFDSTDRAIGVYQREGVRLRKKILNPFYWLGLLVVWFLRLPFRFLTAAGFNGAKIEGSMFGKLVKLALGLVPLTAAALEIADDWTKVQTFLHSCRMFLHRILN